MPLETMASAWARTTVSLTSLQANLFQLFQPIGGVRATPLSKPRAGAEANKPPPRTRHNKVKQVRVRFMEVSGTPTSYQACACARRLPSAMQLRLLAALALHRSDRELWTSLWNLRDIRIGQRFDAELLTQLRIDAREGVLVFLEEAAHVFASLPDALALVAVPRARL